MKTRKGQGAKGPRGRLADVRLAITVSGVRGLPAAALRRACREALSEEGVVSGRLEVAIVNAPRMCELHEQWMGDASPTDVLTFDLRDKPIKTSVDGQLILCETVARAEARRLGGDWRHELLLYAVHGCLHLCGYDDRRRADSTRMHRREDEILSALGYGAVYSAPNTIRAARSKAPVSRKRLRKAAGRPTGTGRR